MRARRVGKGSDFRLLQNEREIGYVKNGVVGFHGFAHRADATLAASLGWRALSRRRKAAQRSSSDQSEILVLRDDASEFVVRRAGIMARLLPPPSGKLDAGWGFEVELLPNEAFDVFAVARARVIWRAIQGTSLRARMLQFERAVHT